MIITKAQSAIERRASPRICGPIPALAFDMTDWSKQLGAQTMLDNLSAEGFYLRLAHPAQEVEKIMVVTRIAQSLVLLRGTLLRVERLHEGAFGLAFAIVQHRIFSLVGVSSACQEKLSLDQVFGGSNF